MATAPFRELVQQINDVDDLRVFMGLHVYAVWDFMHLLKGLQRTVGKHQPDLKTLVDELITEEESDHLPVGLGGPAELSHFEIYVCAMREIEADAGPMASRIDNMRRCSLKEMLADPTVPEASRAFMTNTQNCLEDGQPEVVAGAYTYGRELMMPTLFAELRNRLIQLQLPCPTLNWYLERHISLDGETHGPLAIKLVEKLIGDDPVAKNRVEVIKKKTLLAREEFWNRISETIRKAKQENSRYRSKSLRKKSMCQT